MVRTKSSEGKKYKPRGRPFAKGNKRGKLEEHILDASGHEISSERGVIEPVQKEPITEPLKGQGMDFEMKSPDSTTDTNSLDSTEVKEQSLNPGEKIVDTIEFKNGENKLCIVIKSTSNRRYRIQCFLNENTEIRPATYTSAIPGMAFWNLLKGSMK